ncbi:hypothetical protein ACLM5H_01240 [Fredinandcohnia humi]
MEWLWVSLLLLNVTVGYRSYRKLRRKRQIFSDRFAMIIAMTSSMVLTLVIGLLYSFIFPLSLFSTSVYAVITGAIVGILFGSMVKMHSVLAGFSGGTSGGLMGAMVGAVAQDPSLCGLPSASSMNIASNMMSMGIFGTFLTLLSFWLITYSLKV